MFGFKNLVLWTFVQKGGDPNSRFLSTREGLNLYLCLPKKIMGFQGHGMQYKAGKGSGQWLTYGLLVSALCWDAGDVYSKYF